jgi:hypothetical protein
VTPEALNHTVATAPEIFIFLAVAIGTLSS